MCRAVRVRAFETADTFRGRSPNTHRVHTHTHARRYTRTHTLTHYDVGTELAAGATLLLFLTCACQPDADHARAIELRRARRSARPRALAARPEEVLAVNGRVRPRPITRAKVSRPGESGNRITALRGLAGCSVCPAGPACLPGLAGPNWSRGQWPMNAAGQNNAQQREWVLGAPLPDSIRPPASEGRCACARAFVRVGAAASNVTKVGSA